MKTLLFGCILFLKVCSINGAAPQEEMSQEILKNLVADHFNITISNNTHETVKVFKIHEKTNRFSPGIKIFPRQTKSMFLKLGPLFHLPTLTASALIVNDSYDATCLIHKTNSLDLFGEDIQIPPHQFVEVRINGNPDNTLNYGISLMKILEKNPEAQLISGQHYYQHFVRPLDPNNKMKACVQAVLAGEQLDESFIDDINYGSPH